MLLRGANAVGYTNYPDNAVVEFCQLGMSHNSIIIILFFIKKFSSCDFLNLRFELDIKFFVVFSMPNPQTIQQQYPAGSLFSIAFFISTNPEKAEVMTKTNLKFKNISTG